MELYAQHGFEQTTVAEIAERAGLTERTFFRHFADKREVLFYGSEMARDMLARAVADAPPAAAPMDAVRAGLEAFGAMIQENPERALLRDAVISANAELRERELIKLATLNAALAEALRQRGVTDPAASLAAEAGGAAFKLGFERWVADTKGTPMSAFIRESLDALKAVAAGA